MRRRGRFRADDAGSRRYPGDDAPSAMGTRVPTLEVPRTCDSERMQSVVPPDLFAAWQHALEHWTQKTAHDTLLGVAAKHQQMAWLASRYREAARSNPQDWIARDRLKAVQRAAALLTFSVPTAHKAPAKMRGSTKLLLAALLSTGIALWLTDVMRVQHHGRTTLISRHP